MFFFRIFAAMRVSVIIPVYNVEHTLNRCVESVLKQHVKGGMEIILVDDGSTDNSGKLCDRLSAQHHQIITIHKKNGGLSDARNAGLDIARGTFITFIDSDDELGDDTLESLVNFMEDHEECDILEYEAWIHYDTPQQHLIGLNEKAYCDMSEYWCSDKAYTHTYAWNKLYRNKLFKDVRFPKGKLFEDIWTLNVLLKSSRSIATTKKGIYCYHDNPEGITNQANGEDLKSLLEAHVVVLNDANLIDRIGFSEYYMHTVNIQIDVYRMTGEIILPNFSDQLRIKRIQSANNKVKAIILKTFGLKQLCKIHKLIKHRR